MIKIGVRNTLEGTSLGSFSGHLLIHLGDQICACFSLKANGDVHRVPNPGLSIQPSLSSMPMMRHFVDLRAHNGSRDH